jgi:hypothetical protein
MVVRLYRASWRSILAAFAIFEVLGLAFVPSASAQSRIRVTVSPATGSVRAASGPGDSPRP